MTIDLTGHGCWDIGTRSIAMRRARRVPPGGSLIERTLLSVDGRRAVHPRYEARGGAANRRYLRAAEKIGHNRDFVGEA